VPRDNGSGYDFEDVRDHYLRELFGEDAVLLRASDPERYRALSRVVTGEVMKRVFAQWRTAQDPCAGGLVWFLRDLWPGAGWGVLDSDGEPKAAWWALKRAWAPQAVLITDEGMDGVAAHAVNETAELLDATLEVELLKSGRVLARASAPLLVPARGTATRSVDALLGYFTDHGNAYRFGPAKYDAVAVRLRRNADRRVLSEDVHFPIGMALPAAAHGKPAVEAHQRPDGDVVLTLEAPCFLQSVRLACAGFRPDDNYFHLVPGERKGVRLQRLSTTARFGGTLEALNLAEAIPLPDPSTPESARNDSSRGA
jgi:beta-mannosidase